MAQPNGPSLRRGPIKLEIEALWWFFCCCNKKVDSSKEIFHRLQQPSSMAVGPSLIRLNLGVKRSELLFSLSRPWKQPCLLAAAARPSWWPPRCCEPTILPLPCGGREPSLPLPWGSLAAHCLQLPPDYHHCCCISASLEDHRPCSCALHCQSLASEPHRLLLEMIAADLNRVLKSFSMASPEFLGEWPPSNLSKLLAGIYTGDYLSFSCSLRCAAGQVEIFIILVHAIYSQSGGRLPLPDVGLNGEVKSTA